MTLDPTPVAKQTTWASVGCFLTRFAWLPIPLCLAAVGVVWAADLRVVWSWPPLNLAVLFGVTALILLGIVIPSARSFLINKQPSVLMLGCGMLLVAVGPLAVLVGLSRSQNSDFAIHSIAMLLSALCQFVGVSVMSPRRILVVRPLWWLIIAYTSSVLIMGAVVGMTFMGWVPVFFVEGQGVTALRDLVVGGAVFLFGVTAGLLWHSGGPGRSPFLGWYALGLVLFAIGLAGSLLIVVGYSPLLWVTRCTQILGAIYMSVAVGISRRAGQDGGVSLTQVGDSWQSNTFLADFRKRSPWEWLLRYGFAVVAVVAAMALRHTLAIWFGPGVPHYLTLFPAVMVVALVAGVGPGLLATAVATGAVFHGNLTSIGLAAQATPLDRLELVLFANISLFVSAFLELYRRNRDKAAAYDREMLVREVSQNYRTLVDLSPDAIAVHADERYIFVNPAAVRLFGASGPEDIVGREVISLIHPDDREFARSRIRLVLQEGQITPIRQIRITRLDGQAVQVETTGARIEFHGRKAVQVILRDVSGIRRAESELRQSEERYRVLFVSSRDAIMTLEPPSWKFTSCNPATVEMFQAGDESRFIAAAPWDLSPEFQPNGQPSADAAKTMIETALRQGSHLFEWQHRRMGGDEFPALVLLTRVELGGSLFLQANVRDISNRKQAEEALKTTLDRFYLVLSNMSEGLLLVTDDGRVEFANQTFCDFFGLKESPSDLRSLTSSEMLEKIRPAYLNPEDALARIKSVVVQGQPIRDEYVAMRGARTFLRDFVPLCLAGKKFGRLWIHRDITEIHETREALEQMNRDLEVRVANRTDELKSTNEQMVREVESRRQAEEQLRQAQKLEAIGTLAGGVAHDFNNILTVIDGYASLALGRLIEGDPLREDLAQIKMGSDRAARLTRQLLAFSRKQTLQPEVINLNEVIQNLAKMLKRLIGEDVDFITSLAEHVGQTTVDPGQIEQVVMNLVVNARDAMPLGGKLIIETANVELDQAYADSNPGVVPGPHVMLAVIDSGCGMDEETKSRIFEPFFTTKEKGKGTGLGLATVYGIVKQSGGSIWVYSELGRGTTFKIYLPRVEAETTSREKREDVVIRGSRELVLVVEDEVAVRGLLEKNLERLGYSVRIAANGGEALLAVEEEGLRPDLLLSDVVMPGMSGTILVQRLRKDLPELKVLFMSGYTDDTVIQHGVLDAETPFMQKPFTVATLATKVSQALGKG